MKKLMTFGVALALFAAVFAEEEKPDAEAVNVDTEEALADVRAEQRGPVAVWPACFALCEWPAMPDVAGLRLTIPFSTVHDSVTGIDLGLWGRCIDFEGFMINVLRNHAKDRCYGIQCGLYNTVFGDFFGIQAGLWNEAESVRGIQCGLVNLSGDAQGIQVGLINRAESLYGFQIGAINVIRNAEVPFFPIANIGF